MLFAIPQLDLDVISLMLLGSQVWKKYKVSDSVILIFVAHNNQVYPLTNASHRSPSSCSNVICNQHQHSFRTHLSTLPIALKRMSEVIVTLCKLS